MKQSELAPNRPILRWLGGKWRLAPWIMEFFPSHRVYVEPFGGGASVLLRKGRSYAEVYNDLDGEIVNLFRVARDEGAALAEALRLTPFARSEFEAAYEPTGNHIEQARRTIVRSFMGFGTNSHARGTGFRANSNRSGSTPAHDWASYPAALSAIVARLQGVVIENRDAVACCLAHDGPETLHYLDPPYVHSTRGKTAKYRFELDDDEHARLRASLDELQGYVLVSGYASELYERLYDGWMRVERSTYADGARERVECLWLNRKLEQAVGHGPLFREIPQRRLGGSA